MMALAKMISVDRNALICDMAETYHIYDLRGLPARTLATLAFGLRADSRIKMRLSDQQLRVNKLMVNSYTSCGSMNKRTRAYMISYLDIITTISSIMLIRSGTRRRSFWNISAPRTVPSTENFATASWVTS